MPSSSSSNSEFVRVLSSHEYRTFTFPKEILYDKNLSGNGLKLLLILLDFGDRPNWQIWQNHLISVSNMGYRKYDSAIKNLEKAGYLKRERTRVKGMWTPYKYKFSAFPIFKETCDKNPLHKESEPDCVFQTGQSKLENSNYNVSSLANVLEETTNLQDDEYHEDGEAETDQENLVSSSPQKLKELEDIERISKSQKETLYKKFSHEKILRGIKSVDLKNARSPFAVIIRAIERGYEPLISKDDLMKDALNVYQQADKFLSNLPKRSLSLGIDEKNVYIFSGTATLTFSLINPNFRKQFTDSLNKLLLI